MSDSQLAKQYQRKTDKQHILDNPDTYIGSVENVDAAMWVFDSESNQIGYKDIEYIPGLYKLFDEGIVNSRDHTIRDKTCKTIKVTIDRETNRITIMNDGNPIPIKKHPEHEVYIPELIFGHLLTSSNYDKNEEKIVGGKNGYGAKLANIFSTEFKITTINNGKKYVQEFRNNMNEKDKPSITSCKTKPYTEISFKPDLKILSFAYWYCFLEMVMQSSFTSYFFPTYSAKPPHPHPISKTLSPLLGLIKSINF